jgi:hypothetical protein
MRKLILLGATAIVAVLVTATITWGDSDARIPSKAETPTTRAATEVGSPSAPGAAKRGGGIRYFETDLFAIPADGRDDSFLRCPRRSKAINGYYGTDGGIVDDYLAVGANSSRNWEFGLIDLTGQDGQAFIGIVCA